jgi:hypothetical protein
MTHKVILLFLICNLNVFSQKMVQNYHEIKMNRISIKNFDKTINFKKLNNSRILTFRPIKWVKITLSGRFNGNVISKIILTNGVDNMGDNADINDYFNITRYDLRFKIYLNKKFRIISRLEISPRKLYFFSSGVIIKF